MKISIQVTFYCIAALFTYGQVPVTQRVLIIKNNNTGKNDTIKTGSFIKLWFRSEHKVKMEQPLYRIDFNRHTYYIESVLIGVTDSALVFFKRPPFMPIPVPIKPNVSSFDTVQLSKITWIRPVNRTADAAAKGAAMMPLTSLLPSYFSSSPGIWIMMPSMQLFNTYYSDAVFRYHRVNNLNSKYTLLTGEIPMDTMYYIQKRKMTGENDYEWEIERLDRYEKMVNHVKREMSDKLLDTYTSNRVISLTLGNTYFPAAYRTAEDVKTRISIAEKRFYFGIASESFISEKHRIGTEIQMNKTERYMAMIGSSGSQISASRGFILSNFSYFKWGLGGVYGKEYKARQWQKIKSLDEEISKERDEIELGYLTSRRSYLRTLLAAEPRPYLMLGVGAVNTTLIKIKGSMADIDATDYSQKRFALEAGAGIFTRVGKRLAYDFSAKYVWTSKYHPYIGGLERYNGIRVQLNIGFMTGPSFARYRRALKMAGMNRDH